MDVILESWIRRTVRICDIARSGNEDVERAVGAARAALAGDWGRMSATDRGRILHRIGEGVLKNIDLLAELEARDVGKPLKQARADVEALARCSNSTVPQPTRFTAIPSLTGRDYGNHAV